MRPIVGTVSLWGTVVEHDLGWRASHAFPERLFVVPGTADARTVKDTVLGLGRYGVPVRAFNTPSLAVAQVERQVRVGRAGPGHAGA